MPVSISTLAKVAVVGGFVSIASASYFTWKIQDNFKKEPYYIRSMELLNGYPPAVSILGAPIETRRLDLGSTSPTFSTGLAARLAIPVSGKKQRGTLHCWASRVNASDSWNVDKLDLEVNSMTWTFYVDPNATDSKPTTNGDISQLTEPRANKEQIKDKFAYL